MNSHLTILEEAIGDIGYWRWWASDLPQMFQVPAGHALRISCREMTAELDPMTRAAGSHEAARPR